MRGWESVGEDRRVWKGLGESRRGWESVEGDGRV